MHLCALIHICGKGTDISLVSLLLWTVCRFVNLRLIFMFDLCVLLKATDLWGLKVNSKLIPLIFFLYLDFEKWMLQNFYDILQCWFYLRRHIHILSLFGIGWLSVTCLLRGVRPLSGDRCMLSWICKAEPHACCVCVLEAEQSPVLVPRGVEKYQAKLLIRQGYIYLCDINVDLLCSVAFSVRRLFIQD